MMTRRADREPQSSGHIAVRNNWLKIFVVVTATTVISVKVWQADFTTMMSGFDFSDLLALLLAMFSIGLSVLFYLKATDTSNVFYDNTYQFTREVSEVLGRVEAGFGEKLTNLNQGYYGLKSAVERIPFDRAQAEKDIAKEERQLEKVEEERAQLIEKLLEQARSDDDEEKTTLLRNLQEQERELSGARREIAYLTQWMEEANGRLVGNEIGGIPSGLLKYLRRRISGHIPRELLVEAPLSELSAHFKNIVRSETGSRFVRDLVAHGVLDEGNNITRRGRMLLRDLLLDEEA